MPPIRKRLPPGNKKGAVRDTETVLKLAQFLEREHRVHGTLNSMGHRLVVINQGMSALAMDLCVSIGTLQNAFRALATTGFILSRDKNYVRLRSSALDEDSMNKLRRTSPDSGYQPVPERALPHISEHRRLGEAELRYLYTAVLRSDGRESAGGVLEFHRKWCKLNGLTPYL